MIILLLWRVILDMLVQTLSTFTAVGIPVHLISVLSDFLLVGIWVVGADLFGATLSVIVFWWVIKFFLGVIVWIWKLLPFT